jgi:F0F1-type ATP synthase membrane subunit c/vacuolar-type H+-ATPase subunit K
MRSDALDPAGNNEMNTWVIISLILYLAGIPFALTVVEYIGGFSRNGKILFTALWPAMGILGLVVSNWTFKK